MASNKKTKKPDTSYMEIDLAGKTHRVDRLDMSDEEWRKTKQTAIDKGVFKFAHDRESVETETSPMTAKSQPSLGDKAAAAKTEEIKARADAQDPNEMVEVSDAKGNKYTVKRADVGKLDAAKLEEQSKNVQDGREGTGTLGGKLKSVAAKLFSGATPTDQGEALVDSIQLPKTTPAVAKKDDVEALVDSIRLPKTKGGAQTPPGDDYLWSKREITAPRLDLPLQNEGPPEPTYVPPEKTPGMLDQIVSGVGDAIDSAESFRSRMMSTNPQSDALLTGKPARMPAAVGGPPEGPMLVDPPPAVNAGNAQLPQGAGNPMSGTTGFGKDPGGSSSVKMSVSSKGVPDPSMPPLVDRRAQLEADTAAVNAARMQKAEADAEGLKAEAAVARDGLKVMTDLELERRMADNVAQEHVRKAQAAYTKTVEEMAAPEKIDPDRWWKSRNTAQKIFAVVSAGLTRGATLGMFQDAISRDIQVQQHDITNARLARGEKANAQHNVYQMARNNGLDERAAYITAEANAWANIERASKLAGMTAKAPSVIAAAQEQAALANQQKTEKLVQLDNHLETQALERKKLFLEERKVESIISMNSRKGGPAAPKPGKALEPGMKQNIIAAREGRALVDRMIGPAGKPGTGVLGKESTIFGGLVDEFMKRVPKTDANRRDKALQLMNRSLMRAIENSAIMKSDQDFYIGKLGGVGIANWTQDDLYELRRKFEDAEKATIDTNRQAGSNVFGFEPGGTPMPSDESALNQLFSQE